MKLIEQLRTFWHERRRAVDAEWRRSLSFADYVVDRWDKARVLGWGEGSSCYDNVLILGEVNVGVQTWVGPNVVLDGSGGGLSIGDHCAISVGAQLYTHNAVERTLSGGVAPLEKAPTVLGNRCYVGPNVVVAAGITIGDGCVIGAGSVVLSDLPPNSKAVGAPARIIGTTVRNDN